jgi:hypothetical protein
MLSSYLVRIPLPAPILTIYLYYCNISIMTTPEYSRCAARQQAEAIENIASTFLAMGDLTIDDNAEWTAQLDEAQSASAKFTPGRTLSLDEDQETNRAVMCTFNCHGCNGVARLLVENDGYFDDSVLEEAIECVDPEGPLLIPVRARFGIDAEDLDANFSKFRENAEYLISRIGLSIALDEILDTDPDLGDNTTSE